jgi:hypothetical protein
MNVENSDRNQENEESDRNWENKLWNRKWTRNRIGWKLGNIRISKLGNGFGGFEIRMNFIDYGVQFQK